jgi:hypothetical protein
LELQAWLLNRQMPGGYYRSTGGYWGIENGLHYRRDVTLKEDRTRVKIGQAPRVMAILNNLVVGLIARNGDRFVPEARRRFSAQPECALRLIIHAI